MLTHSGMQLRSGAVIDFVNEATLQHESEFREFIDFMLARGPIADVIEIGVWEGGSAYLFAQIVGAAGRVYAIDKVFGSEDARNEFAVGVANNIPPVYRGTDVAHRVVEIEGRFEDESTIDQLEAALAGRKVDVLFHDGDHAYGAVMRDIANYGQFVKPGGWVAICDWMDDTHGVHEAWKEIKASRGGHGVWEFVIQRQPVELQKSHRWLGFKNGIGLLEWGEPK